MGLRTIGVRLTADVSDIRSGLRRVVNDTKALTSEFDKAAKAGKLDKVADQAARMGIVAAAGFVLVVRSAAQFERQMSKVDAVTDVSADGMRKLSEAALAAGKATQYSATQAAQAEEELAKAGIGVADILSGGLKGALALAAAGSLELADAADIAAKTMNVFKLKGSDVGHIADVLSASANKSATDVHELGMALKMGGLAASAAGMGLEETVGVLSAFADRALIGSDAGTSLKSMLLMIQAPTDKSAAMMKKLGIEVYDASGSFIGATKLAGVLQKQLGGLTQEQRNAALAQIFGADAMRAANVLYEVGEKGIQDYVDAVDDMGAAQRAAGEKTDNLLGDLERLRGSLETMAIEAGSGGNSGLRVLVKFLSELVDQFGALPSAVSGTLTILAGLSGVALLVFAAMMKMRTAGAEAMTQLAATGRMGTVAAAGLSRVGAMASRAVLGLTGLMVAGALIGTVLHKDLNPQMEALVNSLEDFAKKGEIAGEAARVFGKDASDLDDALNIKSATGFAKWMDGVNEVVLGWVGADGVFTEAQARVEAFDQALAQIVSSGHADVALALLQMRAQATGVSIGDLQKILPQYAAALDTAGRSAGGAAQAQEQARLEAAALSQGLAGVVKEAGSFKEAFDKLHGAAMNFAEAEIKAEEAVDRLSDSLDRNGTTMDINTEKGRENKKALLEGIQAAVEAAQKRYEETGSISVLSQTYNTYIAKLRDAMIAQGMSKAKVDELLGSYAKMPLLVSTTITTPGIDTAISKLRILQNMARDNRLDFATRNREGGIYERQRWGGVTEHAADGLLRQAQVYSAVSSGARYAFAEPETRGEAFVPRHGIPARSLRILDRAAGWYGHTIMPTNWMGAGMGGGTQTVVHEHRHTVTIRGRELISGFRRDVDLSGGSADNLVGRRRS